MAYVFLLTAGMMQGIMIQLNAQLGNHYSLFGVTFFVHAIALVLLFSYLLASKKLQLEFSGAPWYVYFVGFFGIFLVASSSWCTLKVGAGSMLALSTVGQLMSSALIDRFGLFGMPVLKTSRKQIPGYLLVAAGVVLVVCL